MECLYQKNPAPHRNFTMQVAGIVSRDNSKCQLCSIDFPVILHISGKYCNDQWLTTMVISCRESSGQDVRLCGFGMANSKSGDYNLIRSG